MMRAPHRSLAAWSLLVLGLAASSCKGGEPDLLVELRTDLEPGYEFTRVRTELTGEGGGTRTSDVDADPGASYFVGQRVAEFAAVERGSQLVRVQALGAGDRVVAERTVRVRIEETSAIVVLITRDCSGVSCPLSGDDPVATSCLGGMCASPDCVVGDEPGCAPPECATDGECIDAAACAIPHCELGICVYEARADRCGLMERCAIATGCVPVAAGDGGIDAGVDGGARDAGRDGATTDGGPPDAGVDAGPLPECYAGARAVAFCYTGGVQMFTVPAGVTTVSVKLWGAGTAGSLSAFGGSGGYAAHPALTVTPGEVLEVVVGGPGGCGPGDIPATFGGGGRGSDHPTFGWSSSGGGRSALRRAGSDIITAGGGGGVGYYTVTGHGGHGCAGEGGAGGDAGLGASDAPGGSGGGTASGGAGGPSPVLVGHAGTLERGGDGFVRFDDSGGQATSGGGGGGHYGGGSGGWQLSLISGAGGGGSCSVPSGGTYDGGGDGVAGGSSDPDYLAPTGIGGAGGAICNNTDVEYGAPGRVVIRW